MKSSGEISSGAARCVDCGQEVPDDRIFRLLRRDAAGRRHVVCQTCSDRRHAEAQPAPLQVQRTPPPRSVLGGRHQTRRPPVDGSPGGTATEAEIRKHTNEE